MAQADSEKDVKQQHKIAETHKKKKQGTAAKLLPLWPFVAYVIELRLE